MSISQHNGITDRLSSQLAMELGELIQGLPIGAEFAVPPSAEICYSLELFLPGVLSQRYPEWERESLDGFDVVRATKTGQATAELLGTCILISDQTVTPFIAELEVVQTPAGGSVAAIRVMLGEPGGGALGISGPPCNSKDARRLLARLLDRIDQVEWTYTFTKESSRGESGQ